MAVKIRLKRMGAKKRPFYRVVVADARSPRDGRFIESLGYYDPGRHPTVFQVDSNRLRHWMATGARPSDVVRELLERDGTLPPTPRPRRVKPETVPAPAPSAPEAPEADAQAGPKTPAEEPVAAEAEAHGGADAEASEPGAEAATAGDAGGPETEAEETEPAPDAAQGGDQADAEG